MNIIQFKFNLTPSQKNAMSIVITECINCESTQQVDLMKSDPIVCLTCGYGAISDDDRRVVLSEINNRQSGEHKVSNCLSMFVMYEHPKDFPQSYVVRQMILVSGLIFKLDEPTMVTDSLENARKSLPLGLYCLERTPWDDPVILETWY